MVLTGCPSRFYYYPNNKLYLNPADLKLEYEMIQYKSLNGKNLFALLFRTRKNPKGIIVHFHGNFGNVSNHFLGSAYLVDYGFDVLVFDYQGYGGSEGKPSPKKTVEDGIATLRFAQQLNRKPEAGVGVVGQSLGGAVALVSMADEPEVKGAVIESSFPSYRGMVRSVIRRAWVLWPLYPVYPFFAGKTYDPLRYLEKIPPRPVLYIYGTNDQVVPPAISDALYKKAPEPKELWVIDGGQHIGGQAVKGDIYKERVAAFFSRVMRVTNNKEATPAPAAGRSAAPTSPALPRSAK